MKKRKVKALAMAFAMMLSLFGGIKLSAGKAYAEKTYTVTFDSNGGSEVASQTVSEGGKATEPDEPANGNLIFAGWFVDPSLENIINEETFEYNTYDFDTELTADITLTALWGAELSVNIKGDGQIEGCLADLEPEFDEDYPMQSMSFGAIVGIYDSFKLAAKANEGYKFVKWEKVVTEGETEEDSVYEDYSADEMITLTVTEPISLVAVFESEDEEQVEEPDEEPAEEPDEEPAEEPEDEQDEEPAVEPVDGSAEVPAEDTETATDGDAGEDIASAENAEEEVATDGDAGEDIATDGNAQEAKVEVNDDTDAASEVKTEAAAETNVDKSAQTGDSSQPLLAFLIMIDSALALNYVFLKKRKSGKNK